MRILLVIFNYDTAFPFIQDLESQLKSQPGVEVDVMDSSKLFLKKHSGGISYFGSTWFKKLLRYPKIGTLVRVYYLKKFLKENKGKYDVLNLHSVDQIYIYIAKELGRFAGAFYPMIWGSDFYRSDNALREKKRPIFDEATNIIFANPGNASDFNNYYKTYKDKSIITGFGVRKFELIRPLLSQTNTAAKKSFGIPADKIAVAVGYNSTPGQQHIKILDEIEKIPASSKDKVFLVFQMTYGSKKEYLEAIQTKADQSGFSYTIIDRFLDDEQVSSLRTAIDVVLNAQISDGLSSSIQEHLFAKNIVVVGDWLPYQSLELTGLFFLRSPLNNFGDRLVFIIDNYSELKKSADRNTEIIYNLSSWKHTIQKWLTVYRGEGKKYLYSDTDLTIKNEL